MKQKILLLLFVASAAFFSTRLVAETETFNTDSPLVMKGHDCEGCRGHHGKRGHRGGKGKVGNPGVTGCPGAQGTQGNRGTTGSSLPPRVCSCLGAPTTFTFKTLQNLGLSGDWQAFVILPDNTVLSGPVVNIQDPSTTFVLNVPLPFGTYSYWRGTYAVILKNISITGLNVPILDSSTLDALVVASNCFSPSIGGGSPNIVFNFFDIPFNPGEAVIFYFGDPGCLLTA